jgi:hypothetical protein
MDVDELMKKAWKSVEEAGIPEALQADAFKEAVAYLRAGDSPTSPEGDDGAEGSTPAPKRKRRSAGKVDSPVHRPPTDLPTEDEFFEQLAAESGSRRVDSAIVCS